MKTKIDKNIIECNDAYFFNDYFELLINRLTHSNMSLEHDLGNPDDSKNAVRLKDNMKAFKNLLKSLLNNRDMSIDLIKETAKKVNASSPYISNDYRKIGKTLAETDIPISDPENIENDMNNLLYKYNNEWKNLDPIEREAMFHIGFIRIHPFEDGNGRTARLLLNFNLLKQEIAPIIITDDLYEYYHQYIKDEDNESMKNLFKIQSQRENEVLNSIFNEHNMIKSENTKKR